jgi:predicted TIM-barrel fold metal-dependent hydrolase
MQRLRIDRAFVRHKTCTDVAPWLGNDMLGAEIAGHPALSAVWNVTPEGRAPAFDPAAALREMLAAGVRMAWLTPKEQEFSPRAWCAGALYEALQSARVPLLLNYDDCAADDIHDIGSNFPGLRLILLRVPRVGRHRMVYPLLKRHANLFVCFDHAFSAFEGFKTLVNLYGEHRWVFGMSYPDAESGAAVTGLMYAGLSDSALEAIGHGNIERLIREVKA